MPERESVAAFAAHRATMAVFLSAARPLELQQELLAGYQPDTPAVVVVRASWPDERVVRTTVADLPRDLAARLDSREMLFKRLKKTFKDERLRLVAGHPFAAEGHDLRNVPAWAGSTAYVEQRFGAWTVAVTVWVASFSQ